jgi:hypothetical protein
MFMFMFTEEDTLFLCGLKFICTLVKAKPSISINIMSRSRWPRDLKRRRSWPLGYWDRGFESLPGHGCLSLCFCVVLSCLDTGLCNGLITRPKSPITCLHTD